MHLPDNHDRIEAKEKIYESQLDAGKGDEYLRSGSSGFGEGFVEVKE